MHTQEYALKRFLQTELSLETINFLASPILCLFYKAQCCERELAYLIVLSLNITLYPRRKNLTSSKFPHIIQWFQKWGYAISVQNIADFYVLSEEQSAKCIVAIPESFLIKNSFRVGI